MSESSRFTCGKGTDCSCSLKQLARSYYVFRQQLLRPLCLAASFCNVNNTWRWWVDVQSVLDPSQVLSVTEPWQLTEEVRQMWVTSQIYWRDRRDKLQLNNLYFSFGKETVSIIAGLSILCGCVPVACLHVFYEQAGQAAGCSYIAVSDVFMKQEVLVTSTMYQIRFNGSSVIKFVLLLSLLLSSLVTGFLSSLVLLLLSQWWTPPLRLQV
jgi:hypothetical protein